MYEFKKKLESYLRVNLLGPGPRLVKKRIYRAAVRQRLRNTGLYSDDATGSKIRSSNPAEARDFSLFRNIQTGSASNTVSRQRVPGLLPWW